MKAIIKRLVGRALDRDFVEKITEYVIAEREPSVSLKDAQSVSQRGTSWNDHERDREVLWTRFFGGLPEGPTMWLEFGVWKGDSMRYFARLDRHPDSVFYGFDSFEGLPEDWRGMEAARFDVKGTPPIIDDSRVHFVKGWFQNSLPPQLDELKKKAEGRKVIVHFDADLYSSTLFLLFTLSAHFPSFYCIFDEYSGHETRALFNFLQASGWSAAMTHRLDWEECPQVVAGRLERGTAA